MKQTTCMACGERLPSAETIIYRGLVVCDEDCYKRLVEKLEDVTIPCDYSKQQISDILGPDLHLSSSKSYPPQKGTLDRESEPEHVNGPKYELEGPAEFIPIWERIGQQDLQTIEMLPREINGITREQMTELGFKFGNDIDDFFVQCSLPPGWKKISTDHALWSDLIDAEEKKRANIFYKAVFYDRSAVLYWLG